MIVKLIIEPREPLEAGGEHEGDNVGEKEEAEDEKDLVWRPHALDGVNDVHMTGGKA